MQGDHLTQVRQGRSLWLQRPLVLPSSAIPYGFLYKQYGTLDAAWSLGFYR
jgi:hypothetical protein